MLKAIGLVLFVFAMVVLALAPDYAAQNARLRGDDIPNPATTYQCTEAARLHAYEMAQLAMASHLRAPATAKYPSLDGHGVSVRSPAPCKFEISSFVDSQNVYGAMLRTYWSGTMTYEPATSLWHPALATRD